MIITNSIGNIILGGFDYPENPILITENDDIYSDSYIYGISDSLYKNQNNKSKLEITIEDLNELPSIIDLPNFSIYKDNLLTAINLDKLINSINKYRYNYGVEYNVDFGLLRIIYSEEEFPFIYSDSVIKQIKDEYRKQRYPFSDEFRLQIKL